MELDPESAMDLLSPMDLLPPDCRNHVIPFLGLKDCLRFAATSSTNLKHVIDEVQRRRYEQFMTRPCEEFTVGPSMILPFSVRESSLPPDAELVPMNTTRHPHLHPLQQEDGEAHNRRRFYALPTIQERIQSLHAKISRTHPFNEDLENLVQDLTQEHLFPHDGGNPNRQNRELLEQLASVTYAHRMHASLLSRCTTQLNPEDHGSCPSEDVFNTSLDRYMGDVLSAMTLVGHTYCDEGNEDDRKKGITDIPQGITTGVEGGPSMEQWIESFGFDNEDRESELTVKDWYKFWVFFHSSFLRGPLSVDQAERLTILPLSGILNPFPANETSIRWFIPSKTYARSPKNSCSSRKPEWLQRMLWYRDAANQLRRGVLDTRSHVGEIKPQRVFFVDAYRATQRFREFGFDGWLEYVTEWDRRGRIITWMRDWQRRYENNDEMTVKIRLEIR